MATLKERLTENPTLVKSLGTGWVNWSWHEISHEIWQLLWEHREDVLVSFLWWKWRVRDLDRFFRKIFGDPPEEWGK
jgi:hypothetical protein